MSNEPNKTGKRKFILSALWDAAVAERGNQYFHQVVTHEAGREQLFSVSNTFRLMMRVADSLHQVVGIQSGDRVAILAEGYGDLIPLYHALWMLGCVVVTIPSHYDASITASLINNSGARIVVYSPALTARVAAVVPHLAMVEKWILSGSVRGTPFGTKGSAFRLDELFQRASRNPVIKEFSPTTFGANGEEIALLAYTCPALTEPHGIALSLRAILAAAENQSSLYIRDLNSPERVASLLPEKHIVSLIHMLWLPLVAPVSSVALSDAQPLGKTSKLLDELYNHQVTAVWMNEDYLDDIRHTSKTQRFPLPAHFRIYFVPRDPFPMKNIESVANLIVPAYAQTEAGGVISVGEKHDIVGAVTGVSDDTVFLTAGSPISGVKVRIVGKGGEAVSDERVGEIVISSDQLMIGYEGSMPGNAFLSPDVSLHSGDRGQWSFDEVGKPHLTLVGREDLFVKRGSQEIGITELEHMLLKIIGVKAVRVAAFHHTKYGYELGAFILALKKAQVTQIVLWKHLLEHYKWDVVPKVFMIADAAQVTQVPSRLELATKFEQFSTADFSRAPKL